MIRLFRKTKKPHVHTPTNPQAIALLRADCLARGAKLRWLCVCGEMVEDD